MSHFNIKPDYNNLGLSRPMGQRLRSIVEDFLIKDLIYYGFQGLQVKFDWSQSCIEGHSCNILGSHLENYSGIRLFDQNDNLFAEGWINYIAEGWAIDNTEPLFFLVYWDILQTLNLSILPKGKEVRRIPIHIWEQIPIELRWQFEKNKI